MKILQKIATALVITLLVVGCNNNNDTLGNCSEICEYTIASGETAAPTISGAQGSYELTFSFAQSGSPFTDGTTAKFTLSDNTLTVEVAGEDCITIKNPIQTSPSEYTFKDTCRDNLAYAVSLTSTGEFNEVNVSSTSGTWYGQFVE